MCECKHTNCVIPTVNKTKKTFEKYRLKFQNNTRVRCPVWYLVTPCQSFDLKTNHIPAPTLSTNTGILCPSTWTGTNHSYHFASSGRVYLKMWCYLSRLCPADEVISVSQSLKKPLFFIVYWLLAVDQLLLSMKPKMTYLRRFLLLVLLTWRTWIWEKLLGCWVQTILGISYAGLGGEKPRLLPVRLDTDGLKLSCTLKVVGCDGFGGVLPSDNR